MRSGLIAFGLLASLSTPALAEETPDTYLLSVTDIPLGKDGALKSFSFSTWGVTFQTICHIPYGWTITAGGSGTPEGKLAGEGSLGITWFRDANPPEFESLALVTLSGPILDVDLRVDHDEGYIPATFKGEAAIAGLDEDFIDVNFKAPLGFTNIRLVEAKSCPAANPR